MNATNANRVVRPANGIGPGTGPSARQQAEKRANDLARQRKQERVKQQAIGYAKGYAQSRYDEAARDIANRERDARRDYRDRIFNGPTTHAH